MFETKISLDLIVHLFPSGSVTRPPASLTSKTPDETSHKFKSFSQNPSIFPDETYARSNAAAPNLLTPAVNLEIFSNSL